MGDQLSPGVLINVELGQELRKSEQIVIANDQGIE